jgi:23S rRNA pseudouridine1911/1915/1917 synthase
MSKSNWRINEKEAGLRLDKWLAAESRLGSRARALAALEKGQVFLNEREQSAAAAGHRLQAGEQVRLWLDRPGSAQRRNYAGAGKRFAGLHIVYEDQALLVINKPAGLLTVPLPEQPQESSLQARVAEHLHGQGKLKPFIVHRIDRDTSGLVVFAKNFAAQQSLKNQFERREPERVYWAIVYGHPQPATGTWRDELVWDQKELRQRAARHNDEQKQEAICRYRVLEKFAQASLLEVSLVTGKRNQIRMQASLRGHSLIGERKYATNHAQPSAVAFPRQALHALRLSFRHPLDGRKLAFEAPLPADLQALLKRLRSKKPRA